MRALGRRRQHAWSRRSATARWASGSSCVLVDHGLLRQGEAEEVRARAGEKRGLNLHGGATRASSSSRSSRASRDPERKRKIIGAEFIAVFEEEATKLGPIEFLAQGTLYPDVIESVSAGWRRAGASRRHHNVGGLPERMHLKLVEPLRELFKDEVRELGRELGLPDAPRGPPSVPGPGPRGAHARRGRTRRDLDDPAQGRRDLHRGAAPRELVRRDLAGVRGAAAGARRSGVKGDERSYEKRDRAARGRQRRTA